MPPPLLSVAGGMSARDWSANRTVQGLGAPCSLMIEPIRALRDTEACAAI
jgi:hypothetical protein